MIEPDYRLYYCARCRAPVRICSFCDRGNLYCFRGCASLRRSESLRQARRRYYHDNPDGRTKNAERQRRFRLLRRQAVTDHGSPPPSPLPTLAPTAADPSRPRKEIPTHAEAHVATAREADPRIPRRRPGIIRCDACGRPCRPLVRLNYRRCRRRLVLRAVRLAR